MPFQNRVTPFGELIAAPERGLVYGNRGRLHDEARDHPPALAGEALDLLPAGVPRPLPRRRADGAEPVHGPLLPRRGDRARRRAPAVRRVPERGLPQLPRAHAARSAPTTLDERLHAERGRLHESELDELPDGAFVALDERGRGSSSARSSCAGRPAATPSGGRASAATSSVVTPPTSVRVLASGWRGSRAAPPSVQPNVGSALQPAFSPNPRLGQ